MNVKRQVIIYNSSVKTLPDCLYSALYTVWNLPAKSTIKKSFVET